MDSVASAQMAIQAVLDPSPLQLLANSSPAPIDVVWTNTYISRNKRMLRAWSITAAIGLLTVFWTVLLVPIAGALNICTIHEVFPGLAKVLEDHDVLQSLVNTQLPTLAITLLTVLVPFLYDCKCSVASSSDTEANNSRAGKPTRNDIARRRRIERHLQELLFHVLQLLPSFYCPWYWIWVSRYIRPLWSKSPRCRTDSEQFGEGAC